VHKPVEHCANIGQVNAMLGKVALALRFVVSDHAQNVLTKCGKCKRFAITQTLSRSGLVSPNTPAQS
jgi:hypothetical protein